MKRIQRFLSLLFASCSLTLILAACANHGAMKGFEVKMLVGSALGDFCQQAADQFNQQQPKVNGEAFYLRCESEGSGDVVNRVVSLAQQLKTGSLSADSPEFPTLVSLDGEIYQSLLVDRVNQIFPGQNYIPTITDSPLLANSPMVFMTTADLAPGLRKQTDLFQKLVSAKTHRDLDPASQPLPIHYVQTAPTRSNSGLQTVVAQFAAVSGKRPEQLTVDDVQRETNRVKAIQQKVSRYGVSTNSLAQAMVQNGPFWASIASVYESSVIAANSNLQPGQPRYEAVYPKATFASNMRAILPTAPWVSQSEKAAAEQVIAFLQSPEIQKIATNLGLRPGMPGIALSSKFSREFGVDPQASYDSYRPPQPQVVEAMLQTWEQNVKKPSLVVLVVDSSGSMKGNKMSAVQNTLQTYLNRLSPQDQVALIDFDSYVRDPILIDGTPDGRERGFAFINSLQIEGGTQLYDASLAARNWLKTHLRANAINAVLVLTDGQDSSSLVDLDQLKVELAKTGYESDQRISFFTIGYGKEGEFDESVLEQIAAATGGYSTKGDPQTIDSVMENLQLEF